MLYYIVLHYIKLDYIKLNYIIFYPIILYHIIPVVARHSALCTVQSRRRAGESAQRHQQRVITWCGRRS